MSNFITNLKIGEQIVIDNTVKIIVRKLKSSKVEICVITPDKTRIEKINNGNQCKHQSRERPK